MKKKLLIVLGSLVAILGIVYLSGYFDGGEVTAADNEQGETTKAAVELDLSDENIKKTMPNFKDTTEVDFGLEPLDITADP